MTRESVPYPVGTVARYVGPDNRCTGEYVVIDFFESSAGCYSADVLTGEHRREQLRGIPPWSLKPNQDLTIITRQDEIVDRLWMSGTPHKWLTNTTSFDLVVTCNRDAPPAAGVTEVRCHFGDVPLIPPWTKTRIRQTVEEAHAAWADDRTVLVRCRGGMNRSGLITGLILVKAGWSGREAVRLIRERRWHQCLRNPVFAHYVMKGL